MALEPTPGPGGTLHRWDLSPREAVALQRVLASKVRTDLTVKHVRQVGGVDVAYIRETGESIATVVVLRFPELSLIESATVRVATPFPYVPGLLSFREVPPILSALHKLKRDPDLLFVDGHGRAHPRRLGIASHLGLWTGRATIGIGKSRLCGSFSEPGRQRGASSDLIDRDEVIGTVLRSREGVKPIFVSVGFGLPLVDCVQWTQRVTPTYRLPEPIRMADRIAGQSKS